MSDSSRIQVVVPGQEPGPGQQQTDQQDSKQPSLDQRTDEWSMPDKRTNALLINGTPEQLTEAERFLEIIDATEVPGSFIDRKPHAISVEYANVNEIADLIRTLYKDDLVDPAVERARASRGRRGNDDDGDDDERRERREPSRSTANQEESPGVRLTLAVDEQTQEILVACNDQLFEEIQSVIVLTEAGWRVATNIAGERLDPGDRLAVAMRGTILYGDIVRGTLADQRRSGSELSKNRRRRLAPVLALGT